MVAHPKLARTEVGAAAPDRASGSVEVGMLLESAMSHQYKPGDVVLVFQISRWKELVIEGRATIRKRVADIDEQYRVEFANKPGVTCERFVDSWGQDDPEKYVWSSLP